MNLTRPRTAFVGNVVNMPLRTVRALRADGVDAHLYVSTTDRGLSAPENDDPTFSEAQPDWLHYDRWITGASLAAPWRSKLARELSDFDVVVATGPGPIFAQFAGRPWGLLVTGGDLTVKPFPLTFWRWYPSWPHRAAEVIAGAWQRRAIRRADTLWLQPFAPMTDAADRLGVRPDRRSSRYWPMMVDTAHFRPDAPIRPEVEAFVDGAVGESDFVVFHPSRLVMDRSERLVRTGQWKGNDTLIRGFAALVRRGAVRRPVLAMPDTALGRSMDEARDLVAQLEIADHVAWIRPPSGESIDREHMVALYRRADVVSDEFGVGWFGYVALEGLAMGRPVVSHVDERAMAHLYPDGHPIVNARTVEDVARVLGELASDPDTRSVVGAESRKWLESHHAPSAAIPRYVAAIEEVAGRSDSGAGRPLATGDPPGIGACDDAR